MPPSMLSSEALVIWMFRIAMKAPIIAAKIEIHTAGLARSGFCGAASGAARGTDVWDERVRAVMTSPLGNRVRALRCAGRFDGSGDFVLARPGLDGRDHRHARPQLDRRAAFERDLHGDALHHLGEV